MLGQALLPAAAYYYHSYDTTHGRADTDSVQRCRIRTAWNTPILAITSASVRLTPRLTACLSFGYWPSNHYLTIIYAVFRLNKRLSAELAYSLALRSLSRSNIYSFSDYDVNSAGEYGAPTRNPLHADQLDDITTVFKSHRVNVDADVYTRGTRDAGSNGWGGGGARSCCG